MGELSVCLFVECTSYRQQQRANSNSNNTVMCSSKMVQIVHEVIEYSVQLWLGGKS